MDRHHEVKYCMEVAASRMINDCRFRQLDVNAYEIDVNVHVGFFVLQYAKMRILQFYYDFIDRYLESPLFHYCEMDTDNAYLALTGKSVEDLDDENITSGSAPNSSPPKVASNIRTSTCAVDSQVARGLAPSRAVRCARRTIRGRPDCSRWNGTVTGSWDCAERRAIASEPHTSTAPKD